MAQRARKGEALCRLQPCNEHECQYVSPAIKAKGKQIRDWHLNRRSGAELSDLAEEINPQVRGWIGYYAA